MKPDTIASKPVVQIREYSETSQRTVRIADEYDSTGGTNTPSPTSGGASDSRSDSPPLQPIIKTLANPASKPPPVDPLQFVKAPVPALCKQAVEQIQLATENKITKEKVKEEEEEWQANLDKWKLQRRQRVPERLLSRAEEARKLIEEEEQRQVRKVKTFSEMMQERQGRNRYNLNFFTLDDDNYDDSNKENTLQGNHCGDSVDSQSEGKSSDGATSSEERTASDTQSEERMASPCDPWTGDSGVDSMSGSNHADLAVTTGTDLLKEFSSSVTQLPPAKKITASSSSEDLEPASANEVIIRLSINPSSDIFGFTLTQDGHKVLVETVDEDGVADLAGLKKNDEIISLNGVLADSPGSVPSSMDLALMTGQLEMVIYRADSSDDLTDTSERKEDFKRKIARFCADDSQNDINNKPEVIIEPKLVERRKSQLFIQALQMEQEAEQNDKKEKPLDVSLEDQIVLKRLNSLSKCNASTEKKSAAIEIEPQTIEKKKAEFIRQASCENMKKEKQDIAVSACLVEQRKAHLEQDPQRKNESSPGCDLKPKMDVEMTLEERKASFFEQSQGKVEKTLDVPIEPKLIEQRKAHLLERDNSQKSEKQLDVPIESKLEERKASFFENAQRVEKVQEKIDIEPKIIEKKLAFLQQSNESIAKTEVPIVPQSLEQRKVELTLNSMQCKPKIEVSIEPEIIKKRKEALFCSQPANSDIERRRAKISLIDADMYGNEDATRESIPTPSIVNTNHTTNYMNNNVIPDPVLPTQKVERTVQLEINFQKDNNIIQRTSPIHERSESSEDRSMSSSATTVTEIRREVGNAMLSSVASSSLFSPTSERNESPAHLSDLSPDTETAQDTPQSFQTSPGKFDYGTLEPVTPVEKNADRRELSNIVLESPPNERIDAGEQMYDISGGYDESLLDRTPLNAVDPTTDAGHTPWNREVRNLTAGVQEEKRKTKAPAPPVPTLDENDAKMRMLRQRNNFLGLDPQQSLDNMKELANNQVQVSDVESVVRAEIEIERQMRQATMQQLALKQLQEEEMERLNQVPPRPPPPSDEDYYGNVDTSSGAGEQLYQIPKTQQQQFLDLYDQVPPGPPKGHKKGPAPPPPANVQPFQPEELYENASQALQASNYQKGFYNVRVNTSYQPPQAVVQTHRQSPPQVQIASNVNTNNHYGQTKFVEKEQIYGEGGRSGYGDASLYTEVRKREQPIIRQERKSYHEGVVNYGSGGNYEYLGSQAKMYTNEDIYENTRKYAKSCEDIYANTCGQLPRSSHLLDRGHEDYVQKHTYQGPMSTTTLGQQSHDIYENVETYAKTRDYLNNLRKPSVADDCLYETPRAPAPIESASARILSASAAKHTQQHDQMQRSKSQPFMSVQQLPNTVSLDHKMLAQRKSADALLAGASGCTNISMNTSDESHHSIQQQPPIQGRTVINTEIARKKPNQKKGYNANHWLIQEAEMRRQIEANQTSYQNAAQIRGQALGVQGSVVPLEQGVSRVALNVSHQQPLRQNQPSPQVAPTSVRQHAPLPPQQQATQQMNNVQADSLQPLAISGKKRCSLCQQELGRGAAMVIESLQLHFHLDCFRCCVCKQRLGNGTCGTDVRVRNSKLHCQNCYSNDEAGVKLSRV